MSAQSKQAKKASKANQAQSQANQPTPKPGSREGTPKPKADQPRRIASGTALSKSTQSTSNTPTSKPPQEEHVAMNNFNAAEVDAVLRGPTEPKAAIYKPEKVEGAPAVSKSGGPWGTKPNTMGNGKDFWLELRKQVAQLKANGGTSQGG